MLPGVRAFTDPHSSPPTRPAQPGATRRRPSCCSSRTGKGSRRKKLSAAELATLGDPLFRVLLNNRADVVRLSAVEDIVQPDPAKRQTFVVDEEIANPATGQSRRAVISFTGSHPSGVVLANNVMFSVLFDSESFPDEARFIEAWGWDNQRGRYNYYKMDRTGTPDQRPSWKFRGSQRQRRLTQTPPTAPPPAWRAT